MSVQFSSDRSDADASAQQKLRAIDGGGGLPPKGGETYGSYQISAPELSIGSSMFDLRSLISILRRRIWLILGFGLAAGVCAVLYVGQLTPLYSSTAQVVIELDRAVLVSPNQEVVRPIGQDFYSVQTEAAKIGSFEVVARAVELLELEKDPRFNGQGAAGADKSNDSSVAGRIFDDLLQLVGLSSAEEVEPEPTQVLPVVTDPETLRSYIVGPFRASLKVTPAEQSRLISITYISSDPQFAAKAANAVAKAYLESQTSAISAVTQTATNDLEEKVGIKQTELVEAQRRLEEYRLANDLAEVAGENLNQQQLVQMHKELIDAQAVLADLEVRSAQVNALLNGGGAIETAPDVISSSSVQSMKNLVINAESQIAQLAATYRDGHPKMIEAKARLKEAQAALSSEISKISGVLRNQTESARARVTQINLEIERLQGEMDTQNSALPGLAALESEVEAKRGEYNALLQRLNQVTSQAGVNDRPDAQILTVATPSGGAFYPKTNVIIMMAVGGAMVLAIILSVLLELLDSGFRSLGQIESMTGFPTFGMIPVVELKGRALPHQIATGRYGTIFAEAVRTVRTNLMLSGGQRPPRVVVVTSSMPNEGKTTTVLSIAAQTIQTGRRCIVVDCDMRQASLAASIGYPNHPGLSDFLAGAADLSQIIGVDEHTGMHFIGAGTQPSPPVELLGSSRMRNLVKALAQSYHLVILDTPPLLAVSDALILLREADATVFMVRWAKTPRDTVKLGVKAAVEAGARISGVVMSYVDVKKHARYNYADSGYYYNKAYRKYYQTK